MEVATVQESDQSFPPLEPTGPDDRPIVWTIADPELRCVLDLSEIQGAYLEDRTLCILIRHRDDPMEIMFDGASWQEQISTARAALANLTARLTSFNQF